MLVECIVRAMVPSGATGAKITVEPISGATSAVVDGDARSSAPSASSPSSPSSKTAPPASKPGASAGTVAGVDESEPMETDTIGDANPSFEVAVEEVLKVSIPIIRYR